MFTLSLHYKLDGRSVQIVTVGTLGPKLTEEPKSATLLLNVTKRKVNLNVPACS